MIEIELDEDLRRRRDDLRAALETLESSSQQSTAPSSVIARSMELKSLESSINRLSRAIKGNLLMPWDIDLAEKSDQTPRMSSKPSLLTSNKLLQHSSRFNGSRQSMHVDLPGSRKRQSGT